MRNTWSVPESSDEVDGKEKVPKWERIKVMREGREVSVEIEQIIHTVDPNFWVPAVGNGQLGELLKFVERNNLWEAVQTVVRKENGQ